MQFKLRRLPLAVRDEVSQELQKLLENDIIERIEASEWISPIVVSRKKNGQIRLCVDLRGPNSQLVTEVHPLPTIDELHTRLRGTVFSQIDLRSAYHQLMLEPASRPVTAFITHDGLFQYKRVPFGLASAGAALQRLLDKILAGIPGCEHYLDDIVCVGRTQREHDERLRVIMERLQRAKVTINMEKSLFSRPEIVYCGYRVSKHGVAPLTSHTRALLDSPPPSDVRELRSFLGLSGWFAHFIPNYASAVAPMRRLLRKDTAFEWTPEVDEAFRLVKQKIARCSALSLFDPELDTFVTTDASNKGVGGILSQKDARGKERVVSFWSRQLTASEENYSTTEKEALAAVGAIERWKMYLWGRYFTLRTDYSALTTILSPKFSGRADARVVRW